MGGNPNEKPTTIVGRHVVDLRPPITESDVLFASNH